MQERYFGTDGIRGLANQFPMTADMALCLGKALVANFRRHDEVPFKVLIGKDTRRSGYMFESALAAGINAMNGSVLFTGPMPTPAIAHLTSAMRCDAGVVISASHNPYHDNGIKIFGRDGFKLPTDVEEAIEVSLHDPGCLDALASPERIGRSRRIDDALGRYNAFVKSSFERELTLDGLKVVVDCAHGAAYKIAPTVLTELGAEVIETGVTPDGYNINADVGALHPEHCASLVRAHGADIGISLDGDADRLILVAENGLIVDGDFVMAMLAIDLKQRGALNHNTLVTTVMSNLGLHRAMQVHGIKTIQTAVGDRYVVEAMRRGGYNLGGEQSGHLVMLDHSTTGDGLLAALRVLSCMRRSGCRLSELASVMQKYPQVLLNFRVEQKIPIDSLPLTRALIRETESRYGEEGRVLVRYSGTEPKCRVMLEGQDAEILARDAEAIAALVIRETSG
ncbi:MAG: phosphoglucosamine mutase [Proteobacteria bacterium]|nr:phosphoglucosamine mutase [Pseudomonadota bacterium]